MDKKMLKLTNPGLRRSNVVLDSFNGCVADATKEFSRTPEMSFSKMVSKPGMFFEKFKGAVPFKQLKRHTNAHRRRHLNKQVDVVHSNVEFINFEPFSVSHLPQEKLTIHSKSIKLERVFCIFNFPHKVESILSEAVLPRFQIHFLSPKSAGDKAHANFVFISEGLVSSPSHINFSKELNLWRTAIPPCFKAVVSSPLM